MPDAPAPGWYPDPAGTDRLRWWSGMTWGPLAHDYTRPPRPDEHGVPPQTPAPVRRSEGPPLLAVLLVIAALLSGVAWYMFAEYDGDGTGRGARPLPAAPRDVPYTDQFRA